ncbi:HTR1A family protein [Megaselia abdita]
MVNEMYDYALMESRGFNSILGPSDMRSQLVLNISNDVDMEILSNHSSASLYNNDNFNSSFNDSNLDLNLSYTLNTTGIVLNKDDVAAIIRMAITSIILGLMILITIIGNVFVIAAIILERNLHNVANYLVASLAVADLFVACLVMPLGAVYEISRGWILGPELCDIWTSCDVLCCTASILHLVAIAVDRYWAVTNVDYMHSRTSRRIFLMIFLVWSAAVTVSFAGIYWKDQDYLDRIKNKKCMVSQDVAYQVFATCCTFYVPLLVILGLYWKIYQTARKRIHRKRPRPVNANTNNNQKKTTSPKRKRRLKFRIGKRGDNGKTGNSSLGLVEGNSTNTINTVEDTEYSSSNVDSKSRAGIEITTTFTSEEPQITTVSHLVSIASNQSQQVSNNDDHLHQIPTASQASQESKTVTAVTSKLISISNSSLQASSATISTPQCQSKEKPQPNISSVTNPQSKVNKRKETLEAKRERKAAKTLAIITGAFVVCWLPFFVMAILLPLCSECEFFFTDTIASVFLWLGYFNSTLNPVIYTIFSPEFRQAFKRILCGQHRPRHYRSGKI